MTNIKTALIDQCLLETQVSPMVMYCSATGMPIGTLTDDALEALFASVSPADDEQMIDELLIRTLNSARPSPAWNMFEPKTLDRIRHSNPKLLLSYLLNRLYTPLVKSDRGDQFARVTHQEIHQRIKLYSWCQKLEPVFDPLLLVLLELDSRWSLLKLAMPKNIPEILGDGESAKIAEATSILQDWLTKLIESELENTRKLEEQQRSFVRGNSLTRVAYMQEFIRQTPKSEDFRKIVAKKAKRVDDLDFLAGLEADLTRVSLERKPIATMAQPRTAAEPFTPRERFAGVQVAQTKAPLRFGGLK